LRVRAYCPSFGDHSVLDERGFAELSDGSTLGDLLKLLGIPLRPGAVFFFRVNYEKAPLSRELREGDVVSFFAPLAGG